MDIKTFKKTILAHYRKEGRDFPWRRDHSPWGVMVSEFMLQQTQTERVIPYFVRWMELWPTPDSLAAASLTEVLREWSGLGYNRRCKNLKDSAGIIVYEKNGIVPDKPDSLLPLPGVGPYIAGAVACFAYNHPSVFIETNIRSVVLHFFFTGRTGVKDSEILPILQDALDNRNPRLWYYALMDYGAMLKKQGVNPGRASAHHVRQSAFEGSFRQVRGRVLKTLLSKGPLSVDHLENMDFAKREVLYRALDSLQKESMVAENDGFYSIKEQI
jgi:A/G-specific adenine glycosylase